MSTPNHEFRPGTDIESALIQQLHEVATGLANLTGRFDSIMEQMHRQGDNSERIAKLESRAEAAEAHGKEMRTMLLWLLGLAVTILLAAGKTLLK